MRRDLQFSLARLLALTAAFAVLLSLLGTWRWFAAVGNLWFWLFLLCPLWVPLLFCERGKPLEMARPLLSLVPIGWYVTLLCCQWHPAISQYPLVVKPVVLLITLAALYLLSRSARGWTRWSGVPLALSVIAGTVFVVCRG